MKDKEKADKKVTPKRMRDLYTTWVRACQKHGDSSKQAQEARRKYSVALKRFQVDK